MWGEYNLGLSYGEAKKGLKITTSLGVRWICRKKGISPVVRTGSQNNYLTWCEVNNYSRYLWDILLSQNNYLTWCEVNKLKNETATEVAETSQNNYLTWCEVNVQWYRRKILKHCLKITTSLGVRWILIKFLETALDLSQNNYLTWCEVNLKVADTQYSFVAVSK